MSELMTVFGLFLDIVGVVVLFRKAPEKFLDPQLGAFFALEGEDKNRREEWKELQPIRER